MGGGKIVIGDNCFIGYQAVILQGTNIGNNVIIGARAVVKGNIPSNTVWAGCPAKMICTLDEFYEKKKANRINNALYYRDVFREKKGREPEMSEMGLFSFLFLDRTDENYDRFIKQLNLNGTKNSPLLKDLFFGSAPIIADYDTFLALK